MTAHLRAEVRSSTVRRARPSLCGSVGRASCTCDAERQQTAGIRRLRRDADTRSIRLTVMALCVAGAAASGAPTEVGAAQPSGRPDSFGGRVSRGGRGPRVHPRRSARRAAARSRLVPRTFGVRTPSPSAAEAAPGTPRHREADCVLGAHRVPRQEPKSQAQAEGRLIPAGIAEAIRGRSHPEDRVTADGALAETTCSPTDEPPTRRAGTRRPPIPFCERIASSKPVRACSRLGSRIRSKPRLRTSTGDHASALPGPVAKTARSAARGGPITRPRKGGVVTTRSEFSLWHVAQSIPTRAFEKAPTWVRARGRGPENHRFLSNMNLGRQRSLTRRPRGRLGPDTGFQIGRAHV